MLLSLVILLLTLLSRDFAPTSPHSLPSTTSNTPLERDLDDQVPDADATDVGWIDEEGEDEGLDDDLNVDDDEMPMEGEAEADYGQGGDMDGDMDADIPEAGGYEHTDTEVEDESSIEMGSERRGVLDSSVWGGATEQMHAEVEGATERGAEMRVRISAGREN